MLEKILLSYDLRIKSYWYISRKYELDIMEKFKFNILYFPESTPKENNITGILLVVIFGGVFIGLLLNSLLFSFLSLVVGAVGMLFFNVATDGKFQLDNIISDDFISFTEDGIELYDNTLLWKDLKDVKINILNYKGMPYNSGRSRYRGVEENYVEYKKLEEKQRIDFFIESEEEYDFLKTLFIEKVLPILYDLKNVKHESFIIPELEYNDLQVFKRKHGIDRYTDFIYFK